MEDKKVKLALAELEAVEKLLEQTARSFFIHQLTLRKVEKALASLKRAKAHLAP